MSPAVATLTPLRLRRVQTYDDRVFAEAEGQAKNIALRMLRDTAAKAERAAAACSVE